MISVGKPYISIEEIKSKITDLIGDGWTIEVIKHILKNMEF